MLALLASNGSGMLIDILHLVRSLRRSPASAVAAILTLSLALGAGASIFAVVDAVLLAPPPFNDPAALVTVGEIPVDRSADAPRAVSYATFEAWRERSGPLAALEAFDGTNLTMTGLGPAERLSANDVTPGFLTLLGVKPALGRAFEAEDTGNPVVILSHAFWRGTLAGDPAVIGRSLVLGGRAHTIVGVLPEQFLFELSGSDLWRRLPVLSDQAARASRRVSVVGRLAAGASAASLEAALDDVSRTSSPPASVRATSIAVAISGDATGTLGLLALAAALAASIAFANFSGLLLVRLIDRRRELAVRTALGAGRFEIVKQLLLESEALVVVGTVGGMALAAWMTPAVARLALGQFGAVAHRSVPVGWQVTAVVAAAAAVCALIAALPPALLAARRDPLGVLRWTATPPPRERRLRRVLVAGEIALAFVLLSCVALLGRSLLGMLATSPGFDARGVLVLQVSVPVDGYASGRVESFYSALQSALEGRLGPRSVAVVNEIPLTGDRGRGLLGLRPDDARHEVVIREAGPAYFEVMRIPVVAGRSFDSRDDASAPPRAIVSGSLARRLFASAQPVGRRIWFGAPGQSAEIIGVVGDVTHRALDEPPLPTVYRSALQASSRSMVIAARSARADGDVVATVRDEVARLDPELPVYRARAMQEVVSASPGVPARQVLTAAFTMFGALALLLGAVGLFGVVAHDVASRRAELALRIALGADAARVARAVLGQGAVMMGSGLVVGILLAAWAWRVLAGAGFATGALHAIDVAAPAAILVAVGAAAIFPAARRAARTDPLLALRGE